MATKGTTTENATTDSILALTPEARLRRALLGVRGSLDRELAATPGLQQRVWARIATEIEADEAAGYDRLARTAG